MNFDRRPDDGKGETIRLGIRFSAHADPLDAIMAMGKAASIVRKVPMHRPQRREERKVEVIVVLLGDLCGLCG